RGRANELQHLLSVPASAHTDARITPQSRPWHGDSRAGTNGNIRQGSAADLQRSVPRTRSISAIGHGALLVAASGILIAAHRAEPAGHHQWPDHDVPLGWVMVKGGRPGRR